MTTLLVAAGGLAGVLARFGIGRATEHHTTLVWSTVGIGGLVAATAGYVLGRAIR